MKKLKGFAKEFGISILSLALPLMASAQATPALPTGNSGGVPTPPVQTVDDVGALLCTIFGWMFYFLIVLAVIFIVIGAYRYLTSSGDAEKVKGATNTLIYAAIAVAVALLAKGIPLIVGDFINDGSVGGVLNAC